MQLEPSGFKHGIDIISYVLLNNYCGRSAEMKWEVIQAPCQGPEGDGVDLGGNRGKGEQGGGTRSRCFEV